MEVCCDNHEEQKRLFKRVSRERDCSEKSTVNGWYSDADQVQNLHNLYTLWGLAEIKGRDILNKTWIIL
jgi:hypothetical protein